MSKYSKEFKLKVVKEYLKGNSGYLIIAKKYKIPDSSSVKKWVRKYNQLGETGLERNKTSYDGNFKLNVVEYMHKNNLSCTETAVHFNLAGATIVSNWERIYYEEGPQGLFVERRGRKLNMSKEDKKKLPKETEEDLIAENQRLRMENAYLKKLQALIQERDNPQNKKK